MTDSTLSRFELDLFTLVAQQDAWRILLLATLDEPVSHEQVAKFLTAFDRDTPAAVETPSTDTTTHDTTIDDLDRASVITDTKSGLMRGSRFTEAFQLGPLS